MITYRALVLVRALARRLPQPVPGSAGALVSYLAFLGLPEKRANIERNFSVVLSRSVALPSSRVRCNARAMARKSMIGYGRVLADFMAFEPLLDGAARDTALTPGFDQIERLIKSGRGAIFATPHFGHWDMAGAVLARRFPGKIAAVAESFSDPNINDLVVRQREGCGLEIVPMENVRRMTRVLREGRILGLLADRPVDGEEGVQVRFFGNLTRLPAGAATLAMLARCPIMVGSLHRRADGRFEGFVLPPIEPVRTGNRASDIAATMQMVAEQLETVIRRAPHQWYMFRNMWPGALATVPSRSFVRRWRLAWLPAAVGSVALANAIRVRRTAACDAAASMTVPAMQEVSL